MIDHKQS